MRCVLNAAREILVIGLGRVSTHHRFHPTKRVHCARTATASRYRVAAEAKPLFTARRAGGHLLSGQALTAHAGLSQPGKNGFQGTGPLPTSRRSTSAFSDPGELAEIS